MNFTSILAVLLLFPGCYSPQAQHAPAEGAKKVVATTPRSERGDQIFAARCGRCHQPPMSLSSRATGMVTMHVRARLSSIDNRLLLKYLAS